MTFYIYDEQKIDKSIDSVQLLLSTNENIDEEHDVTHIFYFIFIILMFVNPVVGVISYMHNLIKHKFDRETPRNYNKD